MVRPETSLILESKDRVVNKSLVSFSLSSEDLEKDTTKGTSNY
jgi:hypothetical protein